MGKGCMARISVGEKGLTLVQAVKALGLAETGGQAKAMIREGFFVVNGLVCTRPGQQLQPGDTFGQSGRESNQVDP